MALRELFALFDVKINGAEQLAKVTTAMDALEGAAAVVSSSISNIEIPTNSLTSVASAVDTIASSAAGATPQVGALSDATKKLEGVVEDASKASSDAGKKLPKKEIEETKEAVEDLSGAWSKLKAGFAALGVAAGVGLVVSAVTELTNLVAPLGRMASTLGVSTDAVQKWMAVATASGASAEDIVSSYKTLAAQQQAAISGNADAVKSFEALGVSLEDLKSLTLDDLLIEVISSVKSLEDNGARLATTQKLLGEGALKLLPSVKAGSEAMREHLDMLGDLAGTYSEDFIKTSAEFSEEMQFMTNSWSVMKSEILMSVLPALISAVSWITSVINGIRDFTRESGFLDRVVKAGPYLALAKVLQLIALNWRAIGAGAMRALSFIRPFLPVIAKFLFWALILDDIITFFMGGDSMLGRFFKKALEIEGVRKTWEGFRSFFDLLDDSIRGGDEALTAFLASLNRGESIWKAFGEAGVAWGGAVADSIRNNVTGPLAEAYDWLLKVTDLLSFGKFGEAIAGIGDVLFDAEDERLNFEAMNAAPQPRDPGSSGGSQSYQDNRVANVNLTGPQTPETVRTAAGEARKIVGGAPDRRNNQGAANALVRGKK